MPFDNTNPEPQVVKDLRAARAYLLEHGWCQGGNGTNEQGQVCIDIALYYSLARETSRYIAAYGVINKSLGLPLGSCEYVKWNDAPERTFQDVLDLIDRTIAAELAKCWT